MIDSMSKARTSTDAEKSVYAARPWLKHYDYWVRPQMNYPRRPLHEILRITAVEAPDLTATSFLGAQLTYHQIRERADAFAAALVSFGIVKGDRVGIMLPNCPQYVIAVFAVLRLGAIVVNVNPLYTPREIVVVAKDSGMRVMLTLDVLAPLTLGVQDQTQLEKVIITSLGEYSAAATETPAAPGTQRFADLLGSDTGTGGRDLPRVEIDPDDVAVLQYTGGTTGVPKGAMLTHHSIFTNVIQTETWKSGAPRRGEEVFLLVIPYFHIYGFTVGMMCGTWAAAQQVLIPKYDPESLLSAIRDLRPTYFPGVPTIYISLLNHPRVRECGIDRIRLFNSGSAPLPIEVLEQFEQLTGGMLCEGYGLSEASPVTHSTALMARRKPGSVGLPLPDTDIKIVDLETGEREIPIGQEGEICIAGPQVMKGYWNRPDETAIALRTDSNGRVWLYTGDVARMDEDGYFYIVQRKKDLIIVSGFNVYPTEVESVLYTHSAVLEAAVIGIPDSYRGEAVKAYVVLKPGAGSVTAEELIDHCAGGLAEFKVPRTIEIRESLPKTAIGKILHRVLRDEHQSTSHTTHESQDRV